MAVHVYIPTPFRRATENRDRVTIEAGDVRAALDGLEGRFAALRGLVRSEGGDVHAHVNIYVNGDAIDDLRGLDTPLRDGDEMSIIPALAGGAPLGRPSGRAPRSAPAPPRG
jgi:sulfur-carrier protein